MNIKKLYFFIIFWLCICNLLSQNSAARHLSFEQIEKSIDSLSNNPDKKWNLITNYIKKAKKEHNLEALFYAYRYASNFGEFSENIKYADSAIITGKVSKNKKIITDSYINRSSIYMNNSMYNKSLDDLLLANKLSIDLGDQYTINRTIYFIAQNKIYLGLYEEANKELEQCMKYFRSNADSNSSFGKDYQMYYLYSLMSYIDSNTRIGKQEQNKIYLKEAFEYINKKKLRKYLPYFISCQGVDYYYIGDYNTAIQKLSEAVRLYNDDWPHIMEAYYLGLSYWKLGKKYAAVKYLEEIDKQYNKDNKLNPQFRSAYEILIKYNDSVGNKDKQLEYINKLMILDRSYEKNYKYLYTKINKEYDTQKLIREKNRIEQTFKLQKFVLIALLVFSAFLIAYLRYRYNHLQKIYKQKFEEIIAEKQEIKNDDAKISQEKTEILDISPEASYDHEYLNKIPGLNPLFVENILKQLSDFEKEEKFLNTQVSQKMLSEELGTNSTYLSKIVNVYKGKNFNTYVNDLRLEYIVNLLKNDARYLNFDVKELAGLSGFSNTENFSDNFQRKYEIKPSYFIKMMKENIRTSVQSHNQA